jgi:hypothetical protein
MSQFEQIFMGAFFDTIGAEKTAQEVEMPVLDQALTNLGLLEEGEEEGVEMPILKQAMENLGLLEEEGTEEAGEEPASMLEALAQAYGPAVIAEREKVAMEKDAAGMIRTKAKSVLKTIGKTLGGSDIKGGIAKLREARRQGKGGVNEPHAKAQLKKKYLAGAKEVGKGAAKAGAGVAITGGGAAAIAALRKKKKKAKDKKKKK